MTVLAPALFAMISLTAPAGAAWQWPLPPPAVVVRGFVPPPHPWLTGHRGVDLAGHPGEIVRSCDYGAGSRSPVSSAVSA